MSAKGDFTADRRLILISAIALIIGAICAVVAVVLLRLIVCSRTSSSMGVSPSPSSARRGTTWGWGSSSSR